MKKINYLLLGITMVILGSCSFSKNYAQPEYYTPGEGVTYQRFYDELSPYGNWIHNGQYGYVWAPFERGFRPYSTNGRWVYTSMGWTWKSNYRWGWAPFHYGRWLYDSFYGWVWVPGYEWAPAWVAWGGSAGYYGWAPLGPGMSININIGAIPARNWCFVPSRYINSSRLDRYYVRPSQNVTIINNTTIINNNYYDRSANRTYNAGPRVMDVERQTNQRIAPVRVVNMSNPGTSEIRRNELAIYRPQIKESNSTDVKPRKVLDAPVRNFDRTPDNNSTIRNNGNGFSNPQNREREDLIRNPGNVRTFPNQTPQVQDSKREQLPTEKNPEINSERNRERMGTIRTFDNKNPNINSEKRQRNYGEINPESGRDFNRTNTKENRNREIAPREESRRVFKNEQPRQTLPSRPAEPVIKERPVQKAPPVKQVETKNNPVQSNTRTFKNN